MDNGTQLRRLLGPVHDDARAFARRLCRSRSEGDDIFHDAVLRAQRKLGGLRDETAFRSWFYRVIISVHRARYRRSLWRRVVPLIGNEISPAASPEKELADRNGASRVREALAALSSVQREAIVLYELEGFKVHEVAELQGVSLSTVKSRLARGRRELRSVYIKRFGMSEPGSRAELAGEVT